MKIEVVSIKDGKFHIPADLEFNGGGKDITNSRLMLCGLSLIPLNFFETMNEAKCHTGGRLKAHFCKRCEKAQSN